MLDNDEQEEGCWERWVLARHQVLAPADALPMDVVFRGDGTFDCRYLLMSGGIYEINVPIRAPSAVHYGRG